MKIAITGTTSGIGKALKNALSSEHEIVCLDRTLFDLTKIEDLEKINLSGVDILVNNAGHSLGGGIGLLNHNTKDWQNIIAVNFQAPIYLTQKFIHQNKKGKIIFITSKAVEKSMGGDSIYSASKAGLSMFVDCIQEEFKNSSYLISEIRPGRIETNFSKNRKIHSSETLENFYKIRPHIHVDKVVEVIKFVIDNDIVNQITIEK